MIIRLKKVQPVHSALSRNTFDDSFGKNLSKLLLGLWAVGLYDVPLRALPHQMQGLSHSIKNATTNTVRRIADKALSYLPKKIYKYEIISNRFKEKIKENLSVRLKASVLLPSMLLKKEKQSQTIPQKVNPLIHARRDSNP